MIVLFRVNLGSNDAKRLGLDHTKCQIGMECEVSDKTAEVLVNRGIAMPVIAEAKPPAIAESKPSPLAGKVKPNQPTHDKEA